MAKRDQDVHFLASKEEVERIHEKMDELGIRSMGAYLRKMALDGYCIRLDLQDVKALVSLLRICSNNLNQYAKRANETGSIYRADIEDDALYDLLACRFIIPIGAAWPLRVLLFLKLTFLEGISWKITRRLFHVDARSVCEKKVIRLARQTSLSCAEIIKCIEMGIRRLKDGYDVLDKLYDDNDLNCDNFAQAVREYHCSREVITAVVNLYLRQQIMIDTY